ncbi:Alpha/Beta hydrolase protein [Dactylonectria macrodidyma]|uniref:Alpha/Beta hydrolase protein n=1 Tax=Dactylonectria macrodidyma TaxID=307937 RepID=A0A9P9ISL7_9HYPO|nr:Alpha/Beta hydrolase protein [Dactylonectria macrodidyma]
MAYASNGGNIVAVILEALSEMSLGKDSEVRSIWEGLGRIRSDLNFHFPETTTPQRFKIQVDKQLLQLTQRKVRDYRPSPNVIHDWSIEGPPPNAVASLARHWSTEYDWRATEKQLNKQKHYATTVPGNSNYSAPIPLHFIHEKSKANDAIPLLLIHGWTSTHIEWSKVIKNLTATGNGAPSFHVVAPDLPGYGFSPAPTQDGQGPREVGRAFDSMMKQLGYDKYVVASTDLGWIVGMWMAVDVGESLIGHYTDFFFLPPTADDLERYAQGLTTPEENDYIAAINAWTTRHFGYATIQIQKPQMVSVALSDSPVGLASWMWDLKYGSSDDYEITFDDMITDTMLMWIQEPVAAIRGYSLFSQAMNFPPTDVPTGASQFGNLDGPWEEISKFPLVPRLWIERSANLVFFNRHEKGGHFPALSQPGVYVDDIKTFVSKL